ncbi:MAG: asparagine synthetase B [Candidatus Latescibacterota bacterium]|nr:MAG: asparagine synthetase B [Candidatus Latescibacterota bacterium]
MTLSVAALPAAAAEYMLIPMDLKQTNHLKAYGLAYHMLTQGIDVEWLLNYRGGSFLARRNAEMELESRVRGVLFTVVGSTEVARIKAEVERENMEVVLLEKAPRLAVYTPPNAQPWDDAVTLALDYAEVPFDKVYDREVLDGDLDQYDWLHLHHEDFTGQFGKFYASYRFAAWYQHDVEVNERLARELGFTKVSDLKKAVASTIRVYVESGGFLFAMCSATDTIDIALAAAGVDVVAREFDHDGVTPGAQSKLQFEHSFAFENFSLEMNPLVYEFSNIDTSNYARLRGPEADYFTLFEFAAKHDPVPAMLTQCHVNVINGFLGQTTGFRQGLVKKSVVLLAKVEGSEEVKYLHGNAGRGTFTFYGGHDPEDYQHAVGDPPTRLELHVNSPGYRLILNNILFPAARKKEQKT